MRRTSQPHLLPSEATEAGPSGPVSALNDDRPAEAGRSVRRTPRSTVSLPQPLPFPPRCGSAPPPPSGRACPLKRRLERKLAPNDSVCGRAARDRLLALPDPHRLDAVLTHG